jgi:trigger factor
MSVSVKNVDSVNKCLTIDVDADAVEAAKKAAIEKVRKEAQVPGFRKGKIPEAILMQRFGDDIKTETMKQAINAAYPNAIKETGLSPLGDPRIEVEEESQDGKPFKFKANIEVYPEVEIKEKDYSGIKLEGEKIVVGDEEVETELLKLQQRMTQLEPVEDGSVGPGMVAMIDFTGTAGGESFPGSEAENYVVDYGSGNLLEAFEARIEGMKANEERDIEFIYPEDFFKHEIAGKTGHFKIKVKEVRRKVVPELCDDFAKELGNFSTLGEVRKELKGRIKDYKEVSERARLKESAIRALIEKHDKMEVPFAMIDAELGNMLEQLKQQMESQGGKFDQGQDNVQAFVKANVAEATNRARGFIVIDAIAKKEGVEVADEDVDARLQAIATQHKKPLEEVRKQLESQNMIGQMSSQIRFEKTLDLVVDKAKVKEVKPGSAKSAPAKPAKAKAVPKKAKTAAKATKAEPKKAKTTTAKKKVAKKTK